MISRVEFIRFRGFDHLRADLAPHAYIVGPNSAGKSTILEALGLADRCLRTARRKLPQLVLRHDGRQRRAFSIPVDHDEEGDPVRYEFGTEETQVSVYWATGACVRMVWSEEGRDGERGFFYLEDDSGDQPRTLPSVRALYEPITVVPVITPLDRVEEVKNLAYVDAKSMTRLASRHFRNHAWAMVNAGEWTAFKNFARPWLPEIELLEVSVMVSANRIAVFYSENDSRVPKELAWAGDGLQIWVQLLWHLYRAQQASTIVLDEPEVYLHPDLQRRLVRLLDSFNAQIVLASHSGEVIAEAPRNGVLWVDRRLNRARRAASLQSFNDLSASLGTGFNLALARSMRANLVLLSDHEDPRVLRYLAKQVGATMVANEHAVSIVPIRNNANWPVVGDLVKSIREVLPTSLPAVILLQGGHRSGTLNDQIANHLRNQGMEVSFWKKPELDNYLLDPETIARVSGAAPEAIEEGIRQACARLEQATRSSFISSWIRNSESSRVENDLREAETEFHRIWSENHLRADIVPGSRIIRELNPWLEREGYRPIDSYLLAKSVKAQALVPEVFNVLLGIDDMIEEQQKVAG